MAARSATQEPSAMDKMAAMERDLREAADIGNATLQELDAQGATLARAHTKAVVVESQAAHAEAAVRRMDSFWSRAYYYVFGAPEVKSDEAATVAAEKAVADAAKASRPGTNSSASTSTTASSSKEGSGGSATAAAPTTATILADDAEVNASLAAMVGTLDTLKVMAHGMGDSVKEQNIRIDAISDSLARTEKHFAVVERKAGDLGVRTGAR